MANQIRISPDTMRERANQFRTESSNLADVISKLDNLLSQLQSEWEGEASRSFSESYTSVYRPNMVKAREMLDSISQSLDETARATEEQDINISRTWA